MFEKNLNIAFLLDFYGVVLSPRTKELLEMYYCDDLSLAEIAENVGISRQGARQAIKKGEDALLDLEAKLGLAMRHTHLQKKAKAMLDIAEKMEKESVTQDTARLICSVRACAEVILDQNTQED